MRTVNTWCPRGSLRGQSLTHAGASLGNAGHGSAIFRTWAHSGTICRCHNGGQSLHRREGVADRKRKAWGRKTTVIWYCIQLLPQKKIKKELEVMANTCYFQFRSWPQKAKDCNQMSLCRRWTSLPYFSCCIEFSAGMAAQSVGLQQVPWVPVHPLWVTAVADSLGNYTGLQNIMARSIGKWSTPCHGSFRQGKSHLNPLQH